MAPGDEFAPLTNALTPRHHQGIGFQAPQPTGKSPAIEAVGTPNGSLDKTQTI
jgi:hypothetical protein